MARAFRQGKSAVTIRTVAAHAGVSAMTVSNVLNGRNVTAATREAVLRAVEELNYTPNPAARQLARASAITLGLLHGEMEQSFFSEILVGVLNAASQQDAQIVLERVDVYDARSIVDGIVRLRDAGAHGVLIPGGVAEQIVRRPELDDLDIPLIAISPTAELAGISSLRIDEVAAARDITDLLIAKGRRRIGFVDAPQGLNMSDGRRRGYLASLEAHGRAAAPELIVAGGVSITANVDAAGRLLDLDPRPDAVFAWNDEIAACVLTAAHLRGLEIPRELIVAGFDDSSVAARVWPALTTVRQPVASMAALALGQIAGQIRGTAETTVTTTYVGYEIVRRASTGDV
ncbi:LacI family DNA-binding transcriptional regulator [Phenylobacterium sp. LjRoot225]|uniref:LacI family DNA-binding transcriptional regulator n=1 Tax=Phenylobacterium sp. LjRoot225 TaxID=3342285 RepID=UPI003ECFB094